MTNGKPYYLVDVPDYVCVIATTQENRLLLVEQYREALGHKTIEFPAGHVDPGESPTVSAARELVEETGFEAESLTLVGAPVWSDTGRLNNRMHCFRAENVKKVREGPLNHEENIRLIEATWSELFEFIQEGKFIHSLNLGPLLLELIQKGKVDLK